MLSDLPDGTHCFVDANIICYHIVQVPPFSDTCTQFLKRIEGRAILASTSSVVVAEAIHKVMLAEAVQRYGLNPQGLAHRLQRHRDLITGLSEHRKVPTLVRALAIHVEPVTLDLLERAGEVSTRDRLLTNDALTVALMEKLGLSHLATNDDNFDSLPGLSVWKPR